MTDHGLIGLRRIGGARTRQWDRQIHLPVAQAKTVLMLGEVEVNVPLVIAIRSGAEHGREALGSGNKAQRSALRQN